MARVTLLQERVPQHVAEGGSQRQREARRDRVLCESVENIEQGQVGLRNGLIEPIFLQKIFVLGVADVGEVCVEDEREKAVGSHVKSTSLGGSEGATQPRGVRLMLNDVLRKANWNGLVREVRFNVGDGVLAVVEDACCEHCVGLALAEDLHQVLEFSGSATGDDRDFDLFADPAGHIAVVACAGPIGVDGVENNLAGSESPGAYGPFDGIQSSGLPSSMGKDFPFFGGDAFGVDGEDDALGAETFCAGGNE
ncbi:MAG: hypothetical protein RLZZ399_2410 [Verrucomicrobiota bacterium]